MLIKLSTIQITYYWGANGYFWSDAVYSPRQDPIPLNFSLNYQNMALDINSMKTKANPIRPKPSATFLLTFYGRLPTKSSVYISDDGYPLHTFYSYFPKKAFVCNYFPSRYTDFNVRNH